MAEFECVLRRSDTIQSETTKHNSLNVIDVVNNILNSSPINATQAATAFEIARSKVMEENGNSENHFESTNHITLSQTLVYLKSDFDSTVYAAAAIHNADNSVLGLENEEEKIWLLLLAAQMDQVKYGKLAKTGVYAVPNDISDGEFANQMSVQDSWKKYQEYGILISNLQSELKRRKREGSLK